LYIIVSSPNAVFVTLEPSVTSTTTRTTTPQTTTSTPLTTTSATTIATTTVAQWSEWGAWR